MEIHCYLSRIVLSEIAEHQQLVVLQERAGERSFPIVIGFFEAAAINRHVQGTIPPRPFTHDLLSSVILESGGRLDRVVVSALREGTFFAELRIDLSAGGQAVVDCRPSDALALAVRAGADIYVEEDVLDEASS